MDETERAELIAALHQSATFGEGMLDLNQRLLDALDSDVNRPSVEDLAYLRAGLERWRAQMATLRQRLVGLTIEPPDRLQQWAKPRERRQLALPEAAVVLATSGALGGCASSARVSSRCCRFTL